jgi:hypothetical protein
MNAYKLQPGPTYSLAPLYLLFMLLLLAAACSTATAQQQQKRVFFVNAAANPLKSLVVPGGAESHPFLVDIDGDGDLDCFSGTYAKAGQFAPVFFYRNEGAANHPVFKAVNGAANPLNSVLTNSLSIPCFADIDADGDQDCFIGEGGTAALLYYQNTGTATHPRFEKQSAAFNPLSMVRLSAAGVACPAFGDMDGDGDLDCVVADESGSLHYFENVGTPAQPRFEHVSGADNPFSALARSAGIYNLSLQDWNKDGLLDLFLNTTYYRNTGTKLRAQFSSSTEEDAPVIDNSAGSGRYSYTPLRWADLDGDGTPELVQGTAKGGFMYQSIAVSSKAAGLVNAKGVYLSPNPSKSVFTLHIAPAAAAAGGATGSTIRIMDVQGKVLSAQNTTSTTVKVGADLLPGVYLLQVLQHNTVIYQQKIIKQ